jgi:hypothetical protein
MNKAVPAISILLLAGAALAEDAPSPVSDEFVQLFSAYCLKAFPDDDAVLKQVRDGRLAPLSPAQVKSFLHKDSGMGWVVGSGSQYVLTIELPPFHTCSLRQVSDHVLDGAPLMAAAKNFVEAGGHKLLPPVGHARPMSQGMVSNSLIAQELDDKDQPLPQAYMYFVVSYPSVARADGSMSKPFYEIRFVRQIYRQQA